ncbi:MAG: hypothetical protein F6J93_03575 [Oscillatoria sp. SIO1A7]|nr:hypothetical protein [Oscillatoria sp. SIO1A7]
MAQTKIASKVEKIKANRGQQINQAVQGSSEANFRDKLHEVGASASSTSAGAGVVAENDELAKILALGMASGLAKQTGSWFNQFLSDGTFQGMVMEEIDQGVRDAAAMIEAGNAASAVKAMKLLSPAEEE